MDFVVRLHWTIRKHDSIWVFMDRLTKSAYFLPMKLTYSAKDYAKLYVKEIVMLYGDTLSIISDTCTQFSSHFQKALQTPIGIKVKLSNAFYSKKNNQV